MNTHWREEDRTPGSPVAFVGYVLLRIGTPELRASDLLLAHADAAGDLNGRIHGQREALGGWHYGKRGVQRIAGALWMPGSRLDTARQWILASNGVWRAPKPEVAP